MTNSKPFVAFIALFTLVAVSFWGTVFLAQNYEKRAAGIAGEPLVVPDNKNNAATKAKEVATTTGDQTAQEAKDATDKAANPAPTPQPAASKGSNQAPAAGPSSSAQGAPQIPETGANGAVGAVVAVFLCAVAVYLALHLRKQRQVWRV